MVCVQVDILVKAKEMELLAQWYTTLLAHGKSFYWMHHMCQYIQQCVPNIVGHTTPTATHDLILDC